MEHCAAMRWDTTLRMRQAGHTCTAADSRSGADGRRLNPRPRASCNSRRLLRPLRHVPRVDLQRTHINGVHSRRTWLLRNAAHSYTVVPTGLCGDDADNDNVHCLPCSAFVMDVSGARAWDRHHASVINSGLSRRDAPAAARSTTADSKRTRMLRG